MHLGSSSCLSDISASEGNWYLHLETKLSNIIHLRSFVLLSLKWTRLSKWSLPKQGAQLWGGARGWNTYYLETRWERRGMVLWGTLVKGVHLDLLSKHSIPMMVSVNPKGAHSSSCLPKAIYINSRWFVCLEGHLSNHLSNICSYNCLVELYCAPLHNNIIHTHNITGLSQYQIFTAGFS